MLDPTEVLTKQGCVAYTAHLFNLNAALIFLMTHSNDLELDETILEILGNTLLAVDKLKKCDIVNT